MHKAKLYKLLLIFTLIFSNSYSFSQEKIFKTECEVLKYFFSAKKTTTFFYLPKTLTDSIYIVADVDNLLKVCKINNFGPYPIYINNSKTIADTVRKESIFSITNRDINFLILTKRKYKKDIYYALFNPKTNAQSALKMVKSKNIYILKKISTGWY